MPTVPPSVATKPAGRKPLTPAPASFKALSWNENPSGGDMALKHTYATMDISFDGDEINGKGLSSFILYVDD